MSSHASRKFIAGLASASLLGTSSLIGASTIFGVNSAQALPIPMDPADPAVSQLWVNPSARANDETTDVQIDILDFSVPNNSLSILPGEMLRTKVRISNQTPQELSNITISVQRQDAASDTASARVALASENYAYYGPNVVLDDALAPGESIETEVEIPTDPATYGSLAITQPGSYPVRLALTGQLDGVASHMDSQRFLLPVIGEPTPENRTPVTMLYPISAQTDVLGGETGEAPEDPPLMVSSDDLADELTESGRLTALIDAYLSSSSSVRATSCLALDPQLIEVINRMTEGYTVAGERISAIPKNQRLRDLWTSSNQPDAGEPGTGSSDASDFLQKLRSAAQDNCVVALPWANTDLNAVSTTGNQWLMREALQRGSTTIEEILGVTPESNVVIPGSGYINPGAANALGWADSSTEGSLEQSWEVQAREEGPEADASSQTALDNPSPVSTATAAPIPSEAVSVLVSDNTVWRTPSADRFHALAEGITAVTYQGSLSATLATLGSSPETVGYANPDSRYDYALDSATARTLTGQSALRLTVANGDEDTPVLVIPPSVLEAQDARMLLDTTSDLISGGQAQAFPLDQYLSTNASQRSDLAASIEVEGMPDETSFGAPFDDPSAITDTEILRATQQATYIDDLTSIMFNDPSIVLTRYGFTAPLRQDLLRALGLNERRSFALHRDATSSADKLLNDNRDTLQQLRSSVALLPPGNVYTRTSSSSPLVIIAQNGLPLPTETQILYSGPDNARINTPGVVRIPASGSISLQMTADLPDDNQRTDLTLWLASSDGATISEPVQISVQPRPNVMGTLGIIALGIAALAVLVALRVIRKKRVTTRPVAKIKPELKQGGRRKASSKHRSGSGHADDSSGSPKPPGNN